MKAMVIGANGQLGVDLVKSFSASGWEVIPIKHVEVDVRNPQQVTTAISSGTPDVVVNTAAFHKVEECERNPQLAYEVNAVAPMNLARTCREHNSTLIHISTDYVFDGKKQAPYSETDLPSPLNVYGSSKVAGEHLIAYSTERYFIVRTCGLYGVAGSSGKGGNFVETMLRKAASGDPIRVVHDQVLTPTFTEDLARGIVQLATTDAYGLYHLSSDGQCSWYEFARAIFELEGLKVSLSPVTTDQFPSPVKRPPYSVMSKQKIKAAGVTAVRPWQEALSQYLRNRTVPKAVAHN